MWWAVLLGVLAAEGGFLKGQLHLHSNRSGDGTTAPADVVRWYASRGYDFIVFTDHERVTVTEGTSGMLVIPGVELTQNVETCDPPPRPGRRCLLHVNALFVSPPPDGRVPWADPVGDVRRLTFLRRALTTTRRMGGLAQLNHPNFHEAVDARTLIALAREGLTLFEVANEAWDSNNTPPDGPSTEALWDAVLSEGLTLYGTATDDAHHFDDAARLAARGEPVFVGDRGFVMVRAAKEPGAIRAALARGDFYASNGVLLGRIERSPRSLVIEVAAAAAGPHTFTFIGPKGRVLSRQEGRRAELSLVGRRSYVRVVVKDERGRRAWVEPVRLSP